MTSRAISKYVVLIEAILIPKEAVLQFVTLTNQAYIIVEHKGFKNIFRSVSVVGHVLAYLSVLYLYFR